MKAKLCPCGRPLHYTNQNNYEYVERMIALTGEDKATIIVGKKTYKLCKHYIALHGVKAEELPELVKQGIATNA